jgi:maltooligosyltrehalose trehalohydrolase
MILKRDTEGSAVTMKLRVWAPGAHRVEIEREGRREPMTRADGGWWEAAAWDRAAATDYAFVLDGGEPLPDPRSPWQPHGVHGPSRSVDHAAFPWTDGDWQPPPATSAVVYELHVGTFTPDGTFAAVIERLDHLVALGVTHVELMPVAEFPGARGWGYDGVYLYAPHHAYGGPEGLKRLVDGCHARGLAVILDVVYNHLGPAGNYLPRFGPYLTGRYRTPWGAAVNLDGRGSATVRRFFVENALAWLRDYHIDGLRIDAVHAIVDTSAIHFLEELCADVRALEIDVGRPFLLIAESDLNDPRIVRPGDIGGYGLDAQWNEDFHHALHAALTGERVGYYADFGSLSDLAATLERGFVYDGRHSVYRDRRHGRPLTGVSGQRLVGCLQNHDQIGNRPEGDRTSRLLGSARLKVGAALVLTSPFVPMLFQGEEWGASSPFLYFTDHSDPALAAAVREGRRREFAAFGWKEEGVPDPQAPATFARSKLDWSEIEREPHRTLLEWHRELIRLRRRLPALCDGRLERVRVRFDEGERWLAIERGDVTVACNLSERRRVVPVTGTDPKVLCLASDTRAELFPGGVALPPDAVAIVAAADAHDPR